MMNDSIKLANLWNKLHSLKEQLDNEIVPVTGHLGLDDPELMIALEILSAKIKNHFKRFRLAAEIRKF